MLQRLSVQDAAAHLGVSVDTVRRRGLKSGQLRGEQASRPQGYSYVVLLEEADERPDPAPPARAGRVDELRFAHETIAELRGERDYLRGQLSAVTAQNQYLLTRLALPAGSPHMQAAYDVAQPAGRRWPWSRWCA